MEVGQIYIQPLLLSQFLQLDMVDPQITSSARGSVDKEPGQVVSRDLATDTGSNRPERVKLNRQKVS